MFGTGLQLRQSRCIRFQYTLGRLGARTLELGGLQVKSASTGKWSESKGHSLREKALKNRRFQVMVAEYEVDLGFLCIFVQLDWVGC